MRCFSLRSLDNEIFAKQIPKIFGSARYRIVKINEGERWRNYIYSVIKWNILSLIILKKLLVWVTGVRKEWLIMYSAWPSKYNQVESLLLPCKAKTTVRKNVLFSTWPYLVQKKILHLMAFAILKVTINFCEIFTNLSLLP